MQIIKIFFLIVFIIPFATYARWPMFAIPTKQQLLATNVFDRSQCSEGYGKIHQGTTLKINSFSAAFCPSNWVWTAVNETECFDLNNLDYINNTIDYIHDDRGLILKSVVKANYGKNGVPLFSLVFSSPDEFWSCYETNPVQHIVSCANDT